LFWFWHGEPLDLGDKYKEFDLLPTAWRVMWLVEWLQNQWACLYKDNLFNFQELFNALSRQNALRTASYEQMSVASLSASSSGRRIM
jgi:hypothetical protein